MLENIQTIAFDADDTLWINEPYFQEAEQQFCTLLKEYLPPETIAQVLFTTEMNNLSRYGYGIKGFVLCMIETIVEVSKGKAPLSLIRKTLELGHELIEKPVELLPGVEATLNALQAGYRLVIATKGDLLDQERKLRQSGLLEYFHHAEIMSDKQEENYRQLLRQLSCSPEHFLMIGNSMKSDVLPVLNAGGFAAHVPYSVTWSHEQHTASPDHEKFLSLVSLEQILYYLP